VPFNKSYVLIKSNAASFAFNTASLYSWVPYVNSLILSYKDCQLSKADLKFSTDFVASSKAFWDFSASFLTTASFPSGVNFSQTVFKVIIIPIISPIATATIPADAANAVNPFPAAAAPIAVPLSPGITLANPPPNLVIPPIKVGHPDIN